MDTMKDTTMQHVTDVTIVPEATAEFIAGLLARIEQLESDLATAEQDSKQKQARIDRLEAVEKERDSYKLALSEYTGKTEWVQRGINDGTVSPKYLGWHRADAMADLLSGAEKERDVLRAKIEAMEKQEPVSVDINAFRSAFEAALKDRNWPMTRQGDGYLSPSTQSAWRIAFSTVRRLQLYLAPGAKGE